MNRYFSKISNGLRKIGKWFDEAGETPGPVFSGFAADIYFNSPEAITEQIRKEDLRKRQK